MKIINSFRTTDCLSTIYPTCWDIKQSLLYKFSFLTCPSSGILLGSMNKLMKIIYNFTLNFLFETGFFRRIFLCFQMVDLLWSFCCCCWGFLGLLCVKKDRLYNFFLLKYPIDLILVLLLFSDKKPIRAGPGREDYFLECSERVRFGTRIISHVAYRERAVWSCALSPIM